MLLTPEGFFAIYNEHVNVIPDNYITLEYYISLISISASNSAMIATTIANSTNNIIARMISTETLEASSIALYLSNLSKDTINFEYACCWFNSARVYSHYAAQTAIKATIENTMAPLKHIIPLEEKTITSSDNIVSLNKSIHSFEENPTLSIKHLIASVGNSTNPIENDIVQNNKISEISKNNFVSVKHTDMAVKKFKTHNNKKHRIKNLKK